MTSKKSEHPLDAASLIRDAQKELPSSARRLFGKRILTLGGLALLSGCDLTNDRSVNAALRKMSSLNDAAQALMFDPRNLAPTYPESMITRPFPFNAFYDIDEVPDVDARTYRLELGGLIKGKRVWTLDELRAMPQRSQVTRHICIEGWSAIGKWGGVRFSDLLLRGRRRHHRKIRRAALRRQLLDEHRHADCIACADTAHADL